MKITDLRDTLVIEPGVVTLIEKIEETTGKAVEIRVDKEMKSPAFVKIARHRMAFHLIKIHPSQERVASYLVANKAANILRMAPLHPEDRLVPATNANTMAVAYEAVRASYGPSAPPLPEKTVEYLVGGIINQLSNLPVQCRIEHWIAPEFPELREKQTEYLNRDLAETVAGASEEIARLTPPLIFTVSNSMTYAYARSMGEILGSNYTQPYNNFPAVARRGKELNEMIGDDDDNTHRGDMRLIDRWAALLGIGDWFTWQDFESMPESYFEDAFR